MRVLRADCKRKDHEGWFNSTAKHAQGSGLQRLVTMTAPLQTSPHCLLITWSWHHPLWVAFALGASFFILGAEISGWQGESKQCQEPSPSCTALNLQLPSQSFSSPLPATEPVLQCVTDTIFFYSPGWSFRRLFIGSHVASLPKSLLQMILLCLLCFFLSKHKGFPKLPILDLDFSMTSF